MMTRPTITVLAAAALISGLAGCSPTIVPFEVDDEFLVKCSVPPPLDGTTGAHVVHWAEKAGPGITECIRVHNGLVTILRSQKEK